MSSISLSPDEEHLKKLSILSDLLDSLNCCTVLSAGLNDLSKISKGFTSSTRSVPLTSSSNAPTSGYSRSSKISLNKAKRFGSSILAAWSGSAFLISTSRCWSCFALSVHFANHWILLDGNKCNPSFPKLFSMAVCKTWGTNREKDLGCPRSTASCINSSGLNGMPHACSKTPTASCLACNKPPLDRNGVVRNNWTPSGKLSTSAWQDGGMSHLCFSCCMHSTGAAARSLKGPVITTFLCSLTIGGIFDAFGWAVATALMERNDTSCCSCICSRGGFQPCADKMDAKTLAMVLASPLGYAVSSLVEKWIPDSECTKPQGLCLWTSDSPGHSEIEEKAGWFHAKTVHLGLSPL